MNTRIEIYKDGLWQPLRLRQDAAIKYNAIINKVGKIATREISHTNTFSLPRLHENLRILGLNVYNPNELARALNAKYVAKYYVEDKLLQEGYLVINNTNGGTIKVNFIEESLSLITKWGSTTFQELLRDEIIDIPSDYADAISDLREYDMDKNAVLTPLGEVGTRGYNLCLFPNNLNAIGDKFQITDNDIRLADSFNPYQSRPVWNAKSVFDLATESFGYTPIYDDSVNWDVVEATYIINSGGSQNEDGESGIQSITHPRINVNTPYHSEQDLTSPGFTFEVKTLFNYPFTESIKPNDIPNWVNPSILESYLPWDPTQLGPWMSELSVFVPDTTEGNVGTMQFIADHSQSSILNYRYDVFSIWKNATAGGDVIIDTVSIDSDGTFTPPSEFTVGTTYQVDLTIDKTYFDTIPTGAESLIGVMVSFTDLTAQSSLGSLHNMIVIETYLPEGVVGFDDSGQFLPDEVDLTYGAPTISVKKLLSSLMHKEGILMSIDNKNKTVKFFNYGEYEAQRLDSEFYDWSKYLLKHNSFIHNTDYGNEFGKLNRVGLNSPYKGNIFNIALENQGEDSKYKDVANNFVSAFKDIQNVVQVNNPTTPYFEYTNTGLGLVEYTGTLGTLTQARANETTQGTFSGLAKLANVNYAQIPEGVRLLYILVDQAVKVDAKFLIPVEVINSLDLSKPIYVEELGGFYIIEEIREYSNGTKPVTVKLIKLIDDFRGLISQETAIVPQILLTGSTTVPDGSTVFDYSINTLTSFIDYTPTSATITFSKLTDSIANGGSLTGDVVTQAVPVVSPYIEQENSLTSSIPITASETGWYQIVVTDTNEGLTSNTIYKFLGNPINVLPPTVTCLVSSMSPGYGVPSGSAPVFYSYNNHINLTTSTFTYQLWDYNNDVALGVVRTLSFPIPGSGDPYFGTVQVAFADGPGFYKINITTNEATSPPPVFGGAFII